MFHADASIARRYVEQATVVGAADAFPGNLTCIAPGAGAGLTCLLPALPVSMTGRSGSGRLTPHLLSSTEVSPGWRAAGWDNEVKTATWTDLDHWRPVMKVQNKCIFEIIE